MFFINCWEKHISKQQVIQLIIFLPDKQRNAVRSTIVWYSNYSHLIRIETFRCCVKRLIAMLWFIYLYISRHDNLIHNSIRVNFALRIASNRLLQVTQYKELRKLCDLWIWLNKHFQWKDIPRQWWLVCDWWLVCAWRSLCLCAIDLQKGVDILAAMQ